MLQISNCLATILNSEIRQKSAAKQRQHKIHENIMKRRLLKIIVTTLSALAIILHIYVHLTQLDFESIMESRRLQIQSYCVDKGTVFENHIKSLIQHCEN